MKDTQSPKQSSSLFREENAVLKLQRFQKLLTRKSQRFCSSSMSSGGTGYGKRSPSAAWDDGVAMVENTMTISNMRMIFFIGYLLCRLSGEYLCGGTVSPLIDKNSKKLLSERRANLHFYFYLFDAV
jgi:hypothetical protein